MSSSVLRAGDFTASLGVNTHLDPDNDSNAYDDISKIVSALSYLGVTDVRDQPNLPGASGGYFSTAYADLAQIGVKFDFCIGSSDSDLSTFISDLNAVEEAHPGSIAAVEGPNEINYNPFTYDGMTGQPAAVAFQTDMYEAVKADPELKGVAVYDFTNGGGDVNASPEPISGLADDANIHVYPANGDQPSWYIGTNNTTVYGTTTVGPEVATESGYNTDTAWAYGVSLDAQAKMTLNDVLDEAQQGVSTTYLYELLDNNPDPGDTSADQHWGLFNYDGTPKPAATALHDLEAILQDTGAGSRSFTTANLPYALSTLPYAGNSMEMEMEKSDGTHDIVLWDEAPLWDQQTQSENVIATTPVTLSLGVAHTSIEVYDPMEGTAPISVFQDVSTISVGLSDHPLVVEISPGTLAAVVPTLVDQAPDQRMGADQAFSFSLPAGSYSDAQEGTVSYAASAPDGSALPSWMSFNQQTGTFTGTTPADTSALRIMVTATTSEGGVSREAFSIYSSPPSPVLQTQQGDIRTPAGSKVTFTLPQGSFSSQDGSLLTLSAMSPGGSPLPSWLAFDQGTDTFSGKVPDVSGGAYGVEVVATSAQGASAAEAFRIYGMPVAPTFLAQAPDQRLGADAAFSFSLPVGSYADPEGGQVAYGARGVDLSALPSWMSFNPSTDVFSGTTPTGSGGTGIRVDAMTPSGGTSAEAFHLYWGGGSTSPDMGAPPK
jgi:hypothetical protein